MDDLISRQAAIDAYGDWYVEEGTEEGFIGTVKQLLETLPSAQPVVHAHWIQDKGLFRNPIVKCSHCGNFLDMNGVNAGRGNANFCPNCGAKMDEEMENNHE